MQEYVPATDTWVFRPAMKYYRSSAAVAAIDNRYIVAVGGFQYGQFNPSLGTKPSEIIVTNYEYYDLISNNWTLAPTLLWACSDCPAVVVGRTI